MERPVTDYSNLFKTYMNLREIKPQQDYSVILPERKRKGVSSDDGRWKKWE